jgi:hypothetical protein
VETDLLNRVKNIQESESQVLQSADQVVIVRRVADRIACVTRELQRGVDWSSARFAVNHARSLNNLYHVNHAHSLNNILRVLPVDLGISQ